MQIYTDYMLRPGDRPRVRISESHTPILEIGDQAPAASLKLFVLHSEAPADQAAWLRELAEQASSLAVMVERAAIKAAS